MSVVQGGSSDPVNFDQQFERGVEGIDERRASTVPVLGRVEKLLGN
jgi:hypothetical protein